MESLVNMSSVINASACEYVDDTIATMYSLRNTTSHMLTEGTNSSDIVFGSVAIVIGLVSVTVGARLFRPVAALVFAVVSFFIVYELSSNSSGITCGARLLISAAIALICACVTTCLIRLALFVIGGVTGAGIVHVTFLSVPDITQKLDEYDVPTIFDKSVVYWGLIAFVGLVVGFWMRWHVHRALEIATSILGGCIVAYGFHTLAQTWDVNVPSLIYIGVAGALAVIGTCFQRKMRNRRLCKSVCGSTTNEKRGTIMESV